ncbi:hypothetical protein CE91St43_20010 [Oscillospiraceae bacterium]|nr:hypothetical protein CE91St43_20010 [Oscillospiraceae bacterium]
MTRARMEASSSASKIRSAMGRPSFVCPYYTPPLPVCGIKNYEARGGPGPFIKNYESCPQTVDIPGFSNLR